MIYLLNYALAAGMFDVVAFAVAAAAGIDEVVVGAVSSEDQFVDQEVKEHDGRKIAYYFVDDEN